jgi:hypothetical protein
LSADIAIGMARRLTGIATAKATMRARSIRATDFAMTGKVTPAYGHFKRTPEGGQDRG